MCTGEEEVVGRGLLRCQCVAVSLKLSMKLNTICSII